MGPGVARWPKMRIDKLHVASRCALPGAVALQSVSALLRALLLLWASSQAFAASESAPPKLSPGTSYDLELANGSVLKAAVFREMKNGEPIFDIPGLGDRLPVKNFQATLHDNVRRWHISAGIAAIVPLDQQVLGFGQGLAADLRAAISVFSFRSAWLPQLGFLAGYTRLTGERAILAGPELAAGPVWSHALDQAGKHLVMTSVHAGTGFYQLHNRSLDTSYAQTTFVGVAGAGYIYRYAAWGYGISYAHTWLFDANYPLQTGRMNFSVTYFGGES